ncbi:MAG: phosphonopyruvate decarboxylase [Alphaproteobacteria bacterium]
MIEADAFLEPARERGFDFYSGVPCSFLTPFINRAIEHPKLQYVGATSEGEAVAIAAGGWLAGRRSVVMCQNSGLGNTVNPLTSLAYPFRIPILLITTWRGQPGYPDEPQHELMGRITGRLLDDMEISHRPFPKEAGDIPALLEEADHTMTASERPFAFIMEKGSVRDDGLDQPQRALPPAGTRHDLDGSGERPIRSEALAAFLDLVSDEAAVIATTGKCGRELFTLADREQHLYQVGSMGCASGLGLGVALNVKRPVVVLDGDGAALMKMGTFATIGAYGPKNLVHVLLDNATHDSTGGQATVSESVDFSGVALACGYAHAFSANTLETFQTAFREAASLAGPTLLHLRIRPGSLGNLGRPTVTPADVARRFQAFLKRA